MARTPIDIDFLSSPKVDHGGGHGHGEVKAKKKTDGPGLEPIKIERTKLMPHTDTERTRILGRRRRTKEHIEFKHELKEDYRRTLSDHVQRLNMFSKSNVGVLDDPAFEADRYLMDMFYDKSKGVVLHEKISDFLKDESGRGWIVTTQLIEQQIAMKNLALALVSQTKSLGENKIPLTSFGSGDLGFNFSWNMPQSREALLAAYADIASDPKRAAYLKEMTGLSLNDFEVIDGKIQERPNTAKESNVDANNLVDSLRVQVDTRKKFYSSLGVDVRRLDSAPDQIFTASMTRSGRMERTGFIGEKMILDNYSRGTEGERDMLGRSSEHSEFGVRAGILWPHLNRDITGNIRRYNKARVDAMCQLLKEEMTHSPAGDKRISSLKIKAAEWDLGGNRRGALEKDTREKIDLLGKDKALLDQMTSSPSAVTSKINNLRMAESDLRGTYAAIFSPGDVNGASPEVAISALLSLRDGVSNGGNPALNNIEVNGYRMQNVAVREGNYQRRLSAEKGRITAAIMAGTRNPISEADIDNEAKAILASEFNEIQRDKKTLSDLIQSIQDKKNAVKTARDSFSEVKDQEDQIDVFIRNYESVVDISRFIREHNIPSAGLTVLDHNLLASGQTEQIFEEINKAKAAIDGYDFNTEAQRMINVPGFMALSGRSAADVLTYVSDPAKAFWPEAVDAVNRAVALGRTGDEAMEMVRGAVSGVVSKSKDIGWTKDENKNESKRKQVLSAQAVARSLDTMRGSPGAADKFAAVGIVSKIIPGIEAKLRGGVSLEEGLRILDEHFARGGADSYFSSGGVRTSLKSASRATREKIMKDAISFSQQTPSIMASEMNGLSRELSRESQGLSDKLASVDVSKEKQGVEMVMDILGRQDEILEKAVEIVRGGEEETSKFIGINFDYDPNTKGLNAIHRINPPADISEAEDNFLKGGGDIIYINIARMLTGGYSGAVGKDRNSAFDKFQAQFPPNKLLGFLMKSFDFNQSVFSAYPKAYSLPNGRQNYKWREIPVQDYTLDHFAQQLKRRVDYRANFIMEGWEAVGRIGSYEMTEGWTKFLDLLYEDVNK